MAGNGRTRLLPVKMPVSWCGSRVVGFTLLLFLLLAGYTGDEAKTARMSGTSAATAAITPQQLTAEGKAQLRAIVDTAELANLRWPKFGKYGAEVKELYDSFGGSLPWVRDFRISSQARSMIQLLKTADSEGLNAEDYEAPQWDGRIADVEKST